MLARCLVSGHGIQIKDLEGDELDGQDECSLLCLICGMPVTNGILLGICALDYRGEDLYPSAHTPGLIVDDVSCHCITNFVPIRSFDSLGHARNHGEISSSGMSLDGTVRRELVQ